MMKKHYISSTVVTNENIDKGVYAITLHAPEIAATAKAGQFVMVYLDKAEMLLPRPISLCDVDRNSGIITLIYMVVGKGTEVMSRWQAGQAVKLTGPLGNGFSFDGMKNVALAGGGVGVPPMLFLLKELTRSGINADVFIGFRQKSAMAQYFKAHTANLYIATEDGSDGLKGNVLDALRPVSKQYDALLACGPIPMLEALAEYAHSKNLPCQVSMEERMACGVGACKGCVVKTVVGYQVCCAYGPVYDSREVIW